MPPPRKAPATPRLSSSLLLLDHQNRVLLVQRSHSKSMSFSSAIVFPGGNLDPNHDSFLLPPSTTLALPTTPPPGKVDLTPELITALKTCAIRETFEETGLLLARPRTCPPKQPPPTETDLTHARNLLLQNTNPSTPRFSQILTSLDLDLDLSSLHLFTTWITPLPNPKRYHTTMFLAFLPPNFTPPPPSPTSTPGGEIIKAHWVHPKEFLKQYHPHPHPHPHSPSQPQPQQKPILFPPQIYLLTALASFLPNRESLIALSQSTFGEYVILPYTKQVLEGDEAGKVVIGIDKPRGDKAVWIKVRPGKEGPEEVEILEREDWKGEKRAKL